MTVPTQTDARIAVWSEEQKYHGSGDLVKTER
jgi:hypothetical protein